MKKLLLLTIIHIPLLLLSQNGIININGGLSINNIRQQTTYINVKDFGAVGDGTTDDYQSLQNAFDYAWANNYNIMFEKDKNYVSSQPLAFNGGTIYGNNATLIDTYSGAQGIGNNHWFLTIEGSIGTSYELQSNISAGLDFCYISEQNIINNIEEGSLIKFYTNLDFVEQNRNQGEIKKVVRVRDSIVYFTEQFYDTYLVSDTLRAAIVYPAHTSIRDLNIKGNKRIFGIGLRLYYTDNPYIENCNFYDNYYAAVYNADSYNANFSYNAYNSRQTDAGYGLANLGAAMNTIYHNGTCFNVRHPTITNGILYGVPWNVVIKNIIARGTYAGMSFATHKNTGSIHFENCQIYNGLEYQDSSLYKGVFSSDSTYALNEIVSYDNMLFESKQGSNNGNNPSDYAATYWDIYDNEIAGFYLDCPRAVIKDCYVYGSAQGLRTGNLMQDMFIDGFLCENVIYGIEFTGGAGAVKLENCRFNNIVVQNDIKKSNKWVFHFDEDTLDNVSIGSVTSVNSGGIYISDITTNDLSIESLNVNDRAIWVNDPQSDSINIIINNLTSKNSNGVIDTDPNTEINNLNVGDLNAIDVTGTIINLEGNCEHLIIGNTLVQSGDNISNFIKSTGIINCLTVNSFSATETGDQFYFCNTTTTIERAYAGAIKIPDSWNDLLYIGTGGAPSLEVINGKFDIPVISRGDGSPEGVLSGRVGAVYYRRDGGANTTLYIKESGTGNTGWIAK